MRISLPEQVWIDFEPASFGSRSLAFLFDFIFRWTLVLIAFVVLLILAGAFLSFGVLDVFAAANHLSGTPLVLLLSFFVLFVLIVEFGYPIYFEVLCEGVSPGKKLMGLRVVDERGLPITFRASFLRTALILIDLLPAMGMTAFFSMLLTPKSQRLGDLVAQTMVVHERPPARRSQALESEQEADSSVSLPLELYNIIDKYLARRRDFSESVRSDALWRILDAVRSHCEDVEVPVFGQTPDQELWLESLFRRSKPQKLTEARLKEDRSINWKEIHGDLEEAERCFQELGASTKALDAAKLALIGQAYQVICQRYAYLCTFYPQTWEAARAAELVRLGRRLIYSHRVDAMDDKKEAFFSRVPASFAALRSYCLVAASLLITSSVLAWSIVQTDPNMAWHFLSEEVASQVAEGHLWTEDIKGVGSLASSRIMTNNIKVTIAAFALGITGGVGTALVLIINGALLGGVFSSLHHYSMAHRLIDFVVAHGFLEISIIIVAGGAGLALGDALIRPGSLSRKRAIQQRGRAVADLILFGALALVPAGLVEGFVSPHAVPLPIKVLLGVVLCLGYWTFLFTGRIFPGRR